MASVLVPVAYVIIIFGGLFVFSYFYRKHTSSTSYLNLSHLTGKASISIKNASIAKVYEPYFPSHPERNAYITLLQKTDPPAHDALLKAALVQRAMADVQRVLRIREDKPALQNLLQKGSIGDELWNSLLAAEKELEAEIMEVVAEANSFVEGWGQVIFPTANEMLANEKMRATFERTNELKAEIGTCLFRLPIDAQFTQTRQNQNMRSNRGRPQHQRLQ
jgi:translocation protein SEC66